MTGLKEEKINMVNIYWCTICRHPEEALPNAKRILDYVDGEIIIHQFPLEDSDDNEARKEFEKMGDKVHLYHEAWTDEFSEYRTKYIEKTGEITTDKDHTWMFVTDTDEFPSIVMLKNLKGLIKKLSPASPNIIKFNSHDIFVKEDDRERVLKNIQVPISPEEIKDSGKELLSSNVSSYYKELLVKYFDTLKYKGKVHHTLVGINFNSMRAPADMYYEHIKTDIELHYHGCRNFYIGGGGIQEKTPKWQEIKRITNKHGIGNWDHMYSEMKNGNLPRELVEFFVAHKDDNDRPNVDSELRSFYTYYFFLHPEELEELVKENPDSSIDKQVTKGTVLKPLFGGDGEIELFVEDMYMKVLGRHAEPAGKHHYMLEIKTGRIKRDELEGIFRNSKEYKRNMIKKGLAS